MIATERKSNSTTSVIDFDGEIKRQTNDRTPIIEQLNAATDQKAKKQIEKKLAALDARLANLRAIAQLSIGDWVTNRKLVGKIAELKMSPGGMPEVWIDWCDGIPAVPETPSRLSKLPENFHCGFEIGDRVIENGVSFTLIRYSWKNSQVVPVIDSGEYTRTSSFESLTSAQGFIVEFLKRDPEPITVHLDLEEVRDDGGTQARVKLDLAHVKSLVEQMEDGKELDPIDVFYDNECYWLADGFHRLAAHKENHSPTIAALLHHGTLRDAILYAVGANADHKPVLPRTHKDKRNAVTILLNDPEWSQWSDLAIAKACKVSDKTVTKIRKELTSEIRTDNPEDYNRSMTSEIRSEDRKSDPDNIRLRRDRYGNVSKIDTTNIGRAGRELKEVFDEEDNQSTTVIIADNGIYDGKTGEIVDYPNLKSAIVEVEGERVVYPLRSLNGENGKSLLETRLPAIEIEKPVLDPDKELDEFTIGVKSRIADFGTSHLELIVQAVLSRPDGIDIINSQLKRRNEELFGLL